LNKPEWTPNRTLAAGKGATIQQFSASAGGDVLEIDVAAWGEGHLKVNGREIAHVRDAKDRRQAFRELNKAAERTCRSRPAGPREGNPPCFPKSKPGCSKASAA
jgi:hypothetical protein